MIANNFLKIIFVQSFLCKNSNLFFGKLLPVLNSSIELNTIPKMAQVSTKKQQKGTHRQPKNPVYPSLLYLHCQTTGLLLHMYSGDPNNGHVWFQIVECGPSCRVVCYSNGCPNNSTVTVLGFEYWIVQIMDSKVSLFKWFHNFNVPYSNPHCT